MKQRVPLFIPLGLLFGVSLVWRLFLLASDVVPFNADEAVASLVARHITQGAHPIFFYGQAYFGTLDAHLIAAGFLLFGANVWVVRVVEMLMYLGVLGSTFWLGKEAFGTWRSGLLGVLLLAIPPVNVTLYTTVTQGGHNAVLLIGNLLLALGLRMGRAASLKGMAGWGFLAGLGFWVHPMTLVYTLPAFALMAWKLKGKGVRNLVRLALLLISGWAIGMLPVWLYIGANGLERVILDLVGSPVAVEQASWLERTGLHLVNLILLGVPAIIGLRPPWAVTWLALPLLPLVLMVWGAVVWFWVGQAAKPSPWREAYLLFSGVTGTLFAAFLFTNYGVDPSGRYFLPLAAPLAIVAGEWAWSLSRVGKVSLGVWGRAAVLGLVVVYQVWGNLQVSLRYPPGITTQIDEQTIIDHRYMGQLIAFLREKGENRGYTHYWVGYPLAFQSGEELIFIPRLPYHADLRYTPRDDRYKPYDSQVSQSEHVAYITTSQTPLLDERLRTGFTALGVGYKEAVIGDYRVFYALTAAVRPEQLNLETGTP